MQCSNISSPYWMYTSWWYSKSVKRTLTISVLLLLFLGGCENNLDKEFICDVKNNTLTHDLRTGEKNSSESFSTWYVLVNASKGKFLFGTSKDFRSGCSSDNNVFWRLTVNESFLLCEELYDGKSNLEGGMKQRADEMPDGSRFMYLDMPVSVTLNRHSLRFTRKWESTTSIKFKSGILSSQHLSGNQSGVCKKGNKQL